MAEFRSINPQEIFDNPFKLFGSNWGLVTAGNRESLNTMTVSWGGLGIMWNKPVAFTFIRPQRYTFEFIEREEYFTLCFFDESYREALSFCGSKSGRNVNKIQETGSTPVFTEGGVPYFEQARLVLGCRKLYGQFLNEQSVLGGDRVLKHYNGDEYHKMYISEILEVLAK